VSATSLEATQSDDLSHVFKDEQRPRRFRVGQQARRHKQVDRNRASVSVEFSPVYLPASRSSGHRLGDTVANDAVFAAFSSAAAIRLGMDAMQSLSTTSREGGSRFRAQKLFGGSVEVLDTNVTIHDESGQWNGVKDRPQILRLLLFFFLAHHDRTLATVWRFEKHYSQEERKNAMACMGKFIKKHHHLDWRTPPKRASTF
jgi:hypothetical protein